MSELWVDSKSWPVLGDAEVQVWLAHLPSALASQEELAAVLSPDEVERAARFRSPAHQDRARITRGILRTLLGRHAQRDAREISFTHSEHGKPALPPTSGIHFNLSHSGEYAAFAITRLGAVGVDVERIREDMPQLDEIARRYFAASEQAQLQSVEEGDRVRAFFTLWTRKEAFVKARGDGVCSGLEQFEVLLSTPRLIKIQGDAQAAAHWSMADIPRVPGYSGAVVVQAPVCAVSYWNWRAALAQRPKCSGPHS